MSDYASFIKFIIGSPKDLYLHPSVDTMKKNFNERLVNLTDTLTIFNGMNF